MIVIYKWLNRTDTLRINRTDKMRTEERVLRPIKHMMDMFVGLEEVKDRAVSRAMWTRGSGAGWSWRDQQGPDHRGPFITETSIVWASLFHFHWVISRNSVCRNVQGVGDSMTLILLFILDTITQNNKGFALNKNCHLFSPPRPCQGLSFHPPTWHMSPGATWERQAQCRVILL